MTDHRATVTGIYEAFGRGDIPFNVDRLADDVQWEQWTAWSPHEAGVPWLQPRRGKEGALEFFQIIGTWTITEFQVLALLPGEAKVAAEIVIDAQLPDGIGCATRKCICGRSTRPAKSHVSATTWTPPSTSR